MLKIRLAVGGKKGKRFYPIVLAESQSPRNGKFIEKLGYYDPFAKEKKLNCDEKKVKESLSKGAQPTDRVHRLLHEAGIMDTHPFHSRKDLDRVVFKNAKKKEKK
ncbi:30S ribosomal protein S16 [Candidatus Nesciobacter abundans]|uniref:Small ribosomal subunit protein bS16 n=1 Tax=Candidatus Nesciobacter abundans TaxID=2601668 RepID=A0A5C0UFM6_9PROT|nr:30S ribosomal protein S16 [Candidatus Nesciobacter abundans]QEK38895.1 30S ribosomal protein S16 [Candidatus Nesciobacter abundans]